MTYVVEGDEHVLGELGHLLQHRVAELGVDLGEALALVVLVGVEHLAEAERGREEDVCVCVSVSVCEREREERRAERREKEKERERERAHVEFFPFFFFPSPFISFRRSSTLLLLRLSRSSLRWTLRIAAVLRHSTQR